MLLQRATLFTRTVKCPLEGKTILSKLKEREIMVGVIDKLYQKELIKIKEIDSKAEMTLEEFVQSRTIRFIASTDTPDRFGDIINQAGWEFTNFRKNPVFLRQHNSREAPTGNSINEEINKEKGLVMDIFFHGLTKESEEQFVLFKAGVMKAVSVGFKPIEVKDFKDPKEKVKLGMSPFGTFFERQELLELSGVTLPANPEALVDDETLEGKFLKFLDNPEFAEKIQTKLFEKYGDVLKEFSKVKDSITGIEDQITSIKGMQNIIATKDVNDNSDSEEAITRKEISEAFARYQNSDN